MPTRRLAAAGLSAALLLGGCQNPDGSTNWGNTLLLGAGVGTAAALIAGSASGGPRHRHYAGGYRGYDGGYRGGYYPDYGGGYGRPGFHRGW
jgi:hypothetical protein